MLSNKVTVLFITLLLSLVECCKSTSSCLSSVGYSDDEALTRLLQTSFLFLVASPIVVVFYSCLLQVPPDIIHPDFVM